MSLNRRETLKLVLGAGIIATSVEYQNKLRQETNRQERVIRRGINQQEQTNDPDPLSPQHVTEAEAKLHDWDITLTHIPPSTPIPSLRDVENAYRIRDNRKIIDTLEAEQKRRDIVVTAGKIAGITIMLSTPIIAALTKVTSSSPSESHQPNPTR